MIFLPKHKRIETAHHMRLRGHFTIYKGNLAGERKKVAEFDNLFLDQGLNQLTTLGTQLNFLHVGTGTTTPAVTQTQLASFLVAIGRNLSPTYTAGQDDDGYYAQTTMNYKSTLGQVVGTISELGAAYRNTNGQLYSRALILDDDGVPTTITLLSTEYLEVDYSIRIYPPLGDETGSITLAGQTYNWTSRALAVTVPTSWGLGVGNVSTEYTYMQITRVQALANANLVPITATTMGGTLLTESYGALTPYSNNSFQRISTFSWAQAHGNHANGISGLQAYNSYTGVPGKFQILVEPAIPKNADRTLSLTLGVSWGRKT